jgi:hypothetical protein
MSVVLPFKQRPVKGTKPRPSAEPRMYCISCCDDRFYIHQSGDVSCYHCHAHIMNLKVIQTR